VSAFAKTLARNARGSFGAGIRIDHRDTETTERFAAKRHKEEKPQITSMALIAER
jgi:hypothetical protein